MKHLASKWLNLTNKVSVSEPRRMAADIRKHQRYLVFHKEKLVQKRMDMVAGYNLAHTGLIVRM